MTGTMTTGEPMEDQPDTNMEQTPAHSLIALVLTAVSFFAAGTMALWSGILLVQGLTSKPEELFGFGTVTILLSGLLVYALFPAAQFWKNRRQVHILLGLCLASFLVIAGTVILAIQGDMAVTILLVFLLSGITGSSTLLARACTGSSTGMALPRTTTTIAALMVATAAQGAGIFGLWNLWGGYWVFFGLFVALFAMGVILFFAFCVTILITAYLVLLKGLNLLTEIAPDS